MKPVTGPSKGGGPGLTVLLVCLVVAGAITLGIWNFWNKKYRAGNFGAKQTNAPTAQTGAATTPAPASTNSNPLARAAAAISKVVSRYDDGTKAATTTQTAPQATAPAAAPKYDGPKLQGIFYRTNGSSAIIDGKTVKVGESVNGVKVLEIKSDSVRAQVGTTVQELTIKKQ